MHTTLVTAAQVASNLGRWAVVDCRFDLKDEPAGLAAYRAAHIPGAVYAHLGHDLSGPTTGANGRHPLPSIETMVATFSRWGIGDDTQVVAYDTANGMFASRLWWMLRYLGHDAVAVLDGGFEAWTRANDAVRSGDEVRSPARFVPSERTDMLVTLEELTAGLAQSARLVDARAAERFEGRVEPLDTAAGHIPGAVNHCFMDNVLADGTMRPAADLRAAFEQVLSGASPDEVVMYCGSGVTACQNLLALEHAGLPGVRLYAGSWSEWSADAARPVETGPSKPSKK